MASATLWPSTEGAVALVTCADLADLDDDTALLVKPLETHGVAPRRAVWDDPAVDRDRFDLCRPRVLRFPPAMRGGLPMVRLPRGSTRCHWLVFRGIRTRQSPPEEHPVGPPASDGECHADSRPRSGPTAHCRHDDQLGRSLGPESRRRRGFASRSSPLIKRTSSCAAGAPAARRTGRSLSTRSTIACCHAL